MCNFLLLLLSLKTQQNCESKSKKLIHFLFQKQLTLFTSVTNFRIEERQTKEREAWAEQIATQVTNRVSNNVNTHTTGEHETTRALANKGFQDIGNKVDAATEKLEAQVAATEKLGAQVIDEIKEFIIQASAQKLTRPGEHSAFGAPPVDTVTLATHDSSAATPFDMEKDEKIASLQNQVKELQHSATKKRLFEDPSKEEEEEEEEAGVPMMKRWKRFGSKIAFGGGKK